MQSKIDSLRTLAHELLNLGADGQPIYDYGFHALTKAAHSIISG